MPSDATILDLKHPNYPVPLPDKKAQALFPQIWAIGNLSLLERPLLGLFCSVRCPGDLILRTYDLARALRDAGVPVISGFHSPIEKDCLDLLLRGGQPVVLCLARSIQNMRLSKDFKAGVEEKRVLVISPFEGKLRRPSRQSSLLRNQLVGILSAAVFVTYAEPGGKTEEFCTEVLNAGKQLYTFESTHNGAIIKEGAIPVDREKLAQWALPRSLP
jgi:predicted Rossmann fold nucleotide-binding protein DprA/Smf involved in DNA uptake